MEVIGPEDEKNLAVGLWNQLETLRRQADLATRQALANQTWKSLTEAVRALDEMVPLLDALEDLASQRNRVQRKKIVRAKIRKDLIKRLEGVKRAHSTQKKGGQA